MNDDKSSINDESKGKLKVNLSAGNNKIKYYECDGNNCTFEILDDEVSYNNEHICSNNKEIDRSKCDTEEKKEVLQNGRISVKSILDCGRQEVLKGVKINLYRINGLAPVLVKSQETNKDGEVVFSNVEDGSYRIIEIIDKEYFEKPKYINWNEITIDCNNKKEKILIVNKLKKYKSKHN